MYTVVQMPDDKVQEEDGLNEPPALPSLQDTVPVGIIGEAELSTTVKENATCDPWVTVAGFGVIVIPSTCNGFTVKVDVPVLPECTLSPPYVAATVTELGEFVFGVNTVVH